MVVGHNVFSDYQRGCFAPPPTGNCPLCLPSPFVTPLQLCATNKLRFELTEHDAVGPADRVFVPLYAVSVLGGEAGRRSPVERRQAGRPGAVAEQTGSGERVVLRMRGGRADQEGRRRTAGRRRGTPGRLPVAAGWRGRRCGGAD